jgi:hypothetical protein
VLGAQLRDMHTQMQRQQQMQQTQVPRQAGQEMETGDPMEGSPPKSQRKLEAVKARRLEPAATSTTAQSGLVGVDMDLTKEA